MVTPISLVVVATFVTLMALVVSVLRRLTLAQTIGEWGTALVSALGALAAALLLYASSRPLEASALWRVGGSLALLAAPVAASVSLRLCGRRSIPRALVLSGAMLGLVVLWLTIRLKGARGNWLASEVALVTFAAAVAVASAACIGWWSKSGDGGR
jgi:hypothetical protein